NEFHMEDQAGKERILLNSPNTQTFVRLGQPNDPPFDLDKLGDEITKMGKAVGNWFANPDINSGGKYGYTLYTSGAISITANTSNTLIIGEATTMTLGDDNKFVGGIRTDSTIGVRFNFPVGGENKAGPFKLQWVGIRERANAQKVITAGNKVNVIASMNKVIGDKVQAAALESEMTALRNRMIAEYTKTMAARTKALATTDEVIATMNTVDAEATTAAASRARTAAAATEAVAQKAAAVAARNKISAASVEATMSKVMNSVSEDVTSVMTAYLDGLHSTM
ncbi:MAG TPA: hypothetical protein PLG18_08970, partial [Syntrophales bacterium]|nr:hypothetical protein [Syntrophales bacterium]